MNRPRLVLTLTVACAAAALCGAAPAWATTFTVDSTLDAPDFVLNNNVCDDGAGHCTLRAAIQETEDAGSPGADTIAFSLAPGTTIDLGSVLPTINDTVTIDGCSASLNHAGPCIGVRANSSSDDSFRVQGPSVAIRGLAITNGDRGIAALVGSDGLQVQNDWLGIKADGTTVEGNQVGVTVTADGAVIGGTAGAPGSAPADRNVFAGNTTAGLDIFVGDDAQVLGNYFGTNASGAAAAANGDDIDLAGNGADPPTGTVIGGTQSSPGTCDGACNVISGATVNGINLLTTGQSQEAADTTISGNFIGLDVTGTSALGNATGIRTVNAPDTTIGGPNAGDRNFITGGSSAISASFAGIPDLTVENNYIGTNLAGTAPLSPPTSQVVSVKSLGAAHPATVTGNRIAMTSGNDMLALGGAGAVVTDNLIGVGPGGEDLGGGSLGIRAVHTDDSTISGNTIGNFGLAGLTLEDSSGNTVTGNFIGTDAAGHDEGGSQRGIEITNFFAGDSSGNTIGGDLPAEQNVISNVTGDAIEIINDSDLMPSPAVVHNDANTIGANRGSGNGSGPDDLFIDLWDDFDGLGEGPGNPGSGPNDGIGAPTVTLAGADHAGGAAAAGATVRVFSKASASPDEIAGFLGSAVAGGGGAWQLAYGAPLADGTRVAATQTDGSGNTSELSGLLVTDGAAPDTSIDSGPSGPTKDNTPTFAFSSEGGASFECKLDGAAFSACSSPLTTAPLPDGSHTFQVRATDASLNTDPTPASRSFKVDTQPPTTKITGGPTGKVAIKGKSKRFKFSFTSSEPGQGGFQCQIDVRRFVLCGSPFKVRLKLGGHTFRVRAYDAAGNPDPKLRVRHFRVVKARRG